MLQLLCIPDPEIKVNYSHEEMVSKLILKATSILVIFLQYLSLNGAGLSHGTSVPSSFLKSELLYVIDSG